MVFSYIVSRSISLVTFHYCDGPELAEPRTHSMRNYLGLLRPLIPLFSLFLVYAQGDRL